MSSTRSPRQALLPLVMLATLAASACAAPSSSESDAANGAITSNDGAVLEFRFTGEVVGAKDADARTAVVSQLQYVQGALTTDVQGNGQVGLVTLTGVTETAQGDKKKIAYTASLPVLWPKATPKPDAYDLSLPADVTRLDAFNDKYDGKCGTNEYGRETFWHDWNPKAADCAPDGADVLQAHASVRPHPKTTEGKYPEYDKVWEDDSLDVVGVFGIISGNTPDDPGAHEMETFLRESAAALQGAARTENDKGATIIRDASVTGKATVGGKLRTVNVTALLVAVVADAGTDFDARFGAATEKADLVVYSGHSELGRNINALAAKGHVTKSKYQLVYLNGCQTFAYLGTAMRDKRIEANGAQADPEGTKYLDIVANALPAYGDDGATSLSIYRAMLGADRPRTYNDLLTDFSPLHLVAVFGEDDNTFKP